MVMCTVADAWFVYSGDGGRTWAPSNILPDYFAQSVSFVDPTHAFVVMDNPNNGNSALAEYKSGGAANAATSGHVAAAVAQQ